jgi:phytanoyl-CoA hydroxylase
MSSNTLTASPVDRAGYETHGYVVRRQLIDPALIDQLVAQYQQTIVPSRYPFFRQDRNRYEPHQINAYGHVQQSFLDIHDYQEFPEFSHHVKQIVCSQALQTALQSITGCDQAHVMQTMLFDANTATPPHQDWWYLDSVPNGHLLGAWIALEDIDERAGRFFVIPGSTDVALHGDKDLPHSQWMARLRQYCDQHQSRISAPALKKGDVLFWNSRTVHGALPTIDPAFSRKSITAHFLPADYAFGNLFVQKDFIRYKQFEGVNFYRNQPDYSWFNRLRFGFKSAIYNSPVVLKRLRQIQSKFASAR